VFVGVFCFRDNQNNLLAVYRLLTAKLSFSMFVEVCTYTTVSHFFLQRELTPAKFIVEPLLTPYLFWANAVYS